MLTVSVPKGQAVLWNYLIQGSLELTEVRIRFKEEEKRLNRENIAAKNASTSIKISEYIYQLTFLPHLSFYRRPAIRFSSVKTKQ